MGLFLGMVGLVLFSGGLVLLLLAAVMRLLKRQRPRLMRWPLLLGAVGVGFVMMAAGSTMLPPAEVAAAPAVRPQPEPEAQEATESQDLATQAPEPDAAPEPTAKPIDIGLFIVKCRSDVKAQLKSPSTAKFPGSLESSTQVRDAGDNVRVWQGYVDSQNSFGATVRTQFVCTYTPATGEVSAALVE